MAVDSDMIHICIYIFTINHFLDIEKNKNVLQVALFLLLKGPDIRLTSPGILFGEKKTKEKTFLRMKKPPKALTLRKPAAAGGLRLSELLL